MAPEPADTAIPPDEVVAHAGFVRRIAFALLRDDAADAAQEALATGLARGPSAPAARRSWLARVVRNVAAGLRRAGGRRARREREVARPESVVSTADVAARAETIRLVSAAVDAL